MARRAKIQTLALWTNGTYVRRWTISAHGDMALQYDLSSGSQADDALPPGAIFCLRAEGEAALATIEPEYPLAPHHGVHVGADGAVLLPHGQAKQVLDALRKQRNLSDYFRGLINDTIDERWWQAALKPGTVGVPAFHVAPVTATSPTAPSCGTFWGPDGGGCHGQ